MPGRRDSDSGVEVGECVCEDHAAGLDWGADAASLGSERKMRLPGR